MPEGHTIHRAARLHEGAALLDGRALQGADAHGKHLFYRWEGGETLPVHLGLFGRFRIWSGDPPEPTDGTRLRFVAAPGTLHLSGPTVGEWPSPRLCSISVSSPGSATSSTSLPIPASLTARGALARPEQSEIRGGSLSWGPRRS